MLLFKYYPPGVVHDTPSPTADRLQRGRGHEPISIRPTTTTHSRTSSSTSSHHDGSTPRRRAVVNVLGVPPPAVVGRLVVKWVGLGWRSAGSGVVAPCRLRSPVGVPSTQQALDSRVYTQPSRLSLARWLERVCGVLPGCWLGWTVVGSVASAWTAAPKPSK